MKYLFILLTLSSCTLPNGKQSKKEFYTLDDFKTLEKIDAHVHLNTNAADFVQQAAEDHFRLLTITLDDPNEPPPMEIQQQFAFHQVKAFPGRVAYATTFSVRHFNEAGWLNQQLAYLQNSFHQGAIAVKIYKVIGMSLRDKSGKLVMIDDPRFDPILDFIEQNNKTVIGHLGEPKNCWLPLDQMTINGDKSYYKENPEYHMYLHPEFPSYHLGSLEWNVDSLASRLDEFPNMAVDMAARITHLEYQTSLNWKKVHDFMIKYQDRLLYGTDLGAEVNSNPEALQNREHACWMRDWKFLTSKDTMSVQDFTGSFKGLQLPRDVIDKIYRGNAQKWFPGL